ncbi:MAG TPA: hypothetical protein PLD88_05195, partial [Candidatus Berkiella sp.]|nr:hypothetical protein [Candidatus Berkiella sp.]
HFIDLISENSEISILVDNKSIQQGSRDRFIHAYTRHDLYPEELDESKQNHIIAHLKSIQLRQKQLSYLLHNLNWYAIKNFLLVGDLFLEKDLIKLCQDLDELKGISKYSVKLLYHYLNPTRCWKESVTPLLDMYYFAYRIGHILGLGEPVTLFYKTKQYSFETEYAPTEVSVKILTDYLDAYAQSGVSSVFEEIAKAYRDNYQLLVKNDSTYHNHAAQTMLSQYRANQLVALMPNWDEHTVSVSLRGNYLVYTNRGLCGDRRYGSKIFKITDHKLINLEFIEGLANASTHQEFNDLLKEVIDFKNPVVRFSSKAQKYSNCTFSNPKANIEALIVLLQTKPNASEEEIKEVAFAEKNRRKYKHFSNFMRNREIDELVKNMFYAQHPMLIQ